MADEPSDVGSPTNWTFEADYLQSHLNDRNLHPDVFLGSLARKFIMATWREFANSAPELASYGKERLHSRIAYLGTSRRDGSPRVHPVSPFIASGHLYVYMEPSSPKGKDLRRNSWYALHCAVEDTAGGQGEFLVRGQAGLVEDNNVRERAFAEARAIGFHPEERYVLFRLSVEEVLATVYEDGKPKRKKWKSSQKSCSNWPPRSLLVGTG